jgi:cytochrome c553
MNLKLWVASLLVWPWLAFAAPPARQVIDKIVNLRPDPARGEQLFGQCGSCHGSDGAGEVSGATPRIAGQHYRVLVRQIVDFRQGRRWDFRMEGVATSHEVIPELQDIADVAFHVSRLDRDGKRGVGDGFYIERGAALYAKSCASCHGLHAEGDDLKEIPRLSGQHAAYLGRQIYDAVDGRRPPLARSHRKLFAPLKFEDVLGVTDYLSRLGWQATPSP